MDAEDREFIARRKSLQYEYTEPLLPVWVEPGETPEAELRQEVEQAMYYLSPEDLADYEQDRKRIHDEVYEK